MPDGQLLWLTVIKFFEESKISAITHSIIRYIIWNIKVKAEKIKSVIKAKYITMVIYLGILKICSSYFNLYSILYIISVLISLFY